MESKLNKLFTLKFLILFLTISDLAYKRKSLSRMVSSLIPFYYYLY